MSDIILALRNATKLYVGTPAIENVDFELRRGESHALVGENGAGKSTLTKVMAGVVTLTSGTMLVDGVEAVPRTPLEARHLGIAMVFQENSLVPTMTVAQNLFLGQEKFYNRLRGIYIAAQQFLQSLNFDVTPTATVGLLGAARKQMVEIARFVLHEAKIIIFDEPCTTLTPEEKEVFLRSGPRPQTPWRVDRVHFPCAGGGADPGRSNYHPARRQACRDRRCRQFRPRPYRAGDGRTRPVQHPLWLAQDQCAACGRARLCRRPENGADGEKQLALGLRRTDHRRLWTGRRRGSHRNASRSSLASSSAISSTAAK